MLNCIDCNNRFCRCFFLLCLLYVVPSLSKHEVALIVVNLIFLLFVSLHLKTNQWKYKYYSFNSWLTINHIYVCTGFTLCNRHTQGNFYCVPDNLARHTYAPKMIPTILTHWLQAPVLSIPHEWLQTYVLLRIYDASGVLWTQMEKSCKLQIRFLNHHFRGA